MLPADRGSGCSVTPLRLRLRLSTLRPGGSPVSNHLFLTLYKHNTEEEFGRPFLRRALNERPVRA